MVHNLQADLGIWQENKVAMQKRLARASGDPVLTQIYGRWHKEIFAVSAPCCSVARPRPGGWRNFSPIPHRAR